MWRLTSRGRSSASNSNMLGIGSNVDALPAALVEELGDGIEDGMVSANVDVEPAGTVREQAIEQHVLVVLGVRDDLHGFTLSLGWEVSAGDGPPPAPKGPIRATVV